MPDGNRQIVLTSRPTGWVAPENFELREGTVPEPGSGDVLVRNIFMSLDPYMRGRMNEAKSYASSFEIGEVLQARVIGEVAASKNDGYAAGDIVFGMLGWEDYSLAKGAASLRHVDAELAPLPYYLGALGMPGMTAWIGLREIGQPKAGETLFVSAASGAVGQIAGQIGRIRGCRVVGSAGSDAKAAYVADELGFDAAFNYKTAESYLAALQERCPDGLDVYFDNVGGAMLDAALEVANPFARFVECGMISQYNLVEREGVQNLVYLTRKRIRMQGFIVSDHSDLLPEFMAEMAGWLESGEVKYRVDVADGLENAPATFIAMLKGENFGKQVVRIGPDS
ncbi:MAG: NADP-dependent oxidoreductase [Alphaproteobacteria bacterium]|jgi:hypothetical protein|nr:NADP-dependent oxidoreductase [Alphaproteobacteria bacterium]